MNAHEPAHEEAEDPAKDWSDQDLAVGANADIDERLVPEPLLHLIPLARQWAFRKPRDQDAFVAAMKKRHPDQVEAFNLAYDLARNDLHAWKLSLGLKHKNNMTAEDWAHPRWAFTSLYKIREITGPSQVFRAEAEAARARAALIHRRERFERTMSEADEVFRFARYAEFDALVTPFEDLLSVTQMKKLNIARAKSR